MLFAVNFLDAKEIWGQDIWGWISDANSIFNIQTWFTFNIKIFDPIDIWRQYIWQQCHSTTRILRPMRSFRFLMPKLFFIHLMMRNLTTRNLMQKWIFKPFMLRNFLAFLDTTYFKDLNCQSRRRQSCKKKKKKEKCRVLQQVSEMKFLETWTLLLLLLEENPSKQAGEINVVKLLELQGAFEIVPCYC